MLTAKEAAELLEINCNAELTTASTFCEKAIITAISECKSSAHVDVSGISSDVRKLLVTELAVLGYNVQEVNYLSYSETINKIIITW